MLLISHRGNVNGPDASRENSEEYVLAAVKAGFDVELDLWVESGEILFLGHDRPAYKTNLDFLKANKDKFWIHCKNLAALSFLSSQKDLNFFWNQNDDYALTSKGYIWTYPNRPISEKNILVVWEKLAKDDLPNCLGVCSDYVGLYK